MLISTELLLMPLFAFVDLVGLLACIVFYRLSPRMLLLVFGFGGQALLTALSFVWRIVLDGSFMSFGPLRIAHLLCGMLIVVGLAVVFSDVQTRLAQLQRRARHWQDDDVTEPMEEGIRAWPPRRSGSEGIR